MTVMREAIDTTTLGWIKPELDETLRQARQDIEAFAENPGDISSMRACGAHLHQVHGTLRMIELYAPAMVAEEMERLAMALQQGEVADRDEACAALMRGVVQLPDYLERLQGGHRDIPIVLLPLLNELRATRGEPGLSESVLFSPDLDRPLPEHLQAPSALPASRAAIAPQLASLRAALATWPEDGAPADAVQLAVAIDSLLADAELEPLRRMLWVASSVAGALRDGALPPTKALHQAFSGVEREARQLLEDDGVAPGRTEPTAEPTRQLLYHVAHSDSHHQALDDLRQAFHLDAEVPSESELAHARGSLSGRNRALLDTVSAAIKEDLLRVKDALDLYLRTGQTDVAQLHPQIDALTRVSDTLGMMDLGVARGVVLQQRDAVHEIVGGRRPADETTLLDIAGALLYVDASLDDQVSRLGLPDAKGGDDRMSSESRKVLDIVVREAIANFGDARQSLVAFVETNWDHAELAELPRLLEEVAGALRMLELPLPASYLVAVQVYAQVELIEAGRIPNAQQLDTLADAFASLEYYLEALRDQRPNRDDILAVARQSLEQLNYWPLPELRAATPLPADGALTFELPQSVEADVAAALALVEEPVPVALAEPVVEAPDAAIVIPLAGGFEHSDDIDDEIREVFLEELEEEITNLGDMLPLWRQAPDDGERLRTIRRVFHTLKGSGRLVGAKTLGEYSWKIENMLNRVLDGTRTASPAVIALVTQVHQTLPQLHAALQGSGVISADLLGMEAVADRLAAGEEVLYVAPTQAPASIEAAAPVSGLESAGDQSDISRVTGLDEVAATLEQPAVEEPSVPASVDPVLLEILGTEVNGHLATIEQWLLGAGSAPEPADDRMQRAIHTLNGAFAMTEVPVITDVTAPTEIYVKRLLSAGVAPTEEGLAAMAAVTIAIRRTLETLESSQPRVPLFEGLAARIEALRDSLPIARSIMPMDDIEPAEFDDGAGESLTVVDLRPYADLAAQEAERVEAERVEAERIEAERVEAGRVEAERVKAERIEAERVEAERVEAERLKAERVEAERVEAERVEAEGLEAERVEAEGLEAERVEAERVEAERVEAERVEAERVEAERIEAERIEAERTEAERTEAERIEAERTEAERIEAERTEGERLEAERLEADRIEADRIEADRIEADRIEAAHIEARRLEVEGTEAERVEAARVEAERIEAGRLEVERIEVERVEAERVEAERVEAERIEAERVETARAQEDERLEYARIEAEDAEADRLALERKLEAERIEADPAIAALLDSLLPPVEDPDEALDLAGLDPELVEIFVEEGIDLLDHSDGLLARLRQAPSEREPLVGLQRDLHTLKGGARMAGIMAVGELGHVMESLLEAVVENRSELGRDGVPLLERGFDRLHAMVTRVGTGRAIAMPDEMIREFDARSRGETYLQAGASAPDQAGPQVPARIDLTPLSAPIGATPIGDEDEIGVRAPQEQVRIRADLLDRLVNYAGEVAIYRARLEQQLGAFRVAIAEMAATNVRVRDQLRRLEIETEAQIIARYQREHETVDATFDPLELDRFSTLQQLSRALSESAADQVSLQGTLDDLTRQYETLLLQQSRVSSDLQEGLMRTRMVPFDGLLPRLRRVVRQASGELGKQVQLKLEGTQGELDRNVLERMTAPLEHMLRNSVAHGLELPAQRKLAGKSTEGTIRLAVRREGSEVVLEVGDDGAGLDRAAIRRRGEERGLVRSDAVLSDADLDMLILEPGFSTADEVSRLAGRGVGMDVVASEVRQLGGTLDIHSTPGKGVTFILRLPQTLAVTQAVFVRIGETSFAVPIASVRGVGRIARDQLAGIDGAAPVYHYGGEDYAVHDMGTLLGQAPAKAEGHLQMPVLLIRSGELRAAVTVDQVVGNREIVVKPVGPQVASVPGIFGATIMGDGRVVVILDVAPLVRRYVALPRDHVPVLVAVPETRRVPLVMVVDDSITMRKVTGRVLERNNFEVLTAKDGLDALERMADVVPDLMLLDIEMPRMDGYELATAMKADPRLRNVPIAMITSRTGEKHRQRAFDLGVNRYLGKPYQEPELLRNVYELLGIERDHE